MTRAVFFDRDGVINEAVVCEGLPYPPQSVDHVRIDREARTSIERLRSRRFSIFVITNQPDVARGTTTREAVEAINAHIASTLPIDSMYVCYHDNGDACTCRKPRPGLIIAAAREHAVDLTRSYVVGDRWSDIEAGRAARCKTVWIERGYKEKQPSDADARVSSLSIACDWILDDCDRS